MALYFEIKLGFRQRNFDIEKLISGKMAFGVYENSYHLTEGVLGSHTVIFDEEKIGRGVEVSVESGKLIFTSHVPSTNSDIELLFKLIQKAIELTGAKNIEYDESKVKCECLDELKDEIKKIHQECLDFFEDVLNDENQRQIMIFGATQVVSIDRDEMKRIVDSWDEYENYLHQVQSQDLYFASPMFLQNNDDILALYTLTDGVRSSFPLEKNFLIDTEQVNVTKWCVGLFDLNTEDFLGMIPYDDFLSNVDTTNMLDAERFIVELNIDEMKVLMGKYGEAL